MYMCNVSVWVTCETKSHIYEICYDENKSISDVVRNLIEKGLIEYDKEKGITNN